MTSTKKRNKDHPKKRDWFENLGQPSKTNATITAVALNPSSHVLPQHCYTTAVIFLSSKYKKKHHLVQGLNTVSSQWNPEPRSFWEHYDCLRLVTSFLGYWVVQTSINWHFLILAIVVHLQATVLPTAAFCITLWYLILGRTPMN